MQIIDACRVLSADHRGSSWPVLIETADGLRFTKLRGAAQGTGPLVAEIVVAALASAVGLNVPAQSVVRIEPGIESDDRHGELRDLLDRSVGENLGFTYLAGGTMIDAQHVESISRDDAAVIVWLDALVMNPDRTAANPNLMRWDDKLWVIDHGAALGFHYAWSAVADGHTGRPWSPDEPHVLESRMRDLDGWDEILAARLTRDCLQAAIDGVPDSFLAPLLDTGPGDSQMSSRRAAYATFLWKRLAPPRAFFRPLPGPAERRRQAVPGWLARPK